MQYIPFSMLKAIHEQTHSALPHAPLRPFVPKRHPLRAVVRRWRERRVPAPPAVALTLVPTDLCEAEVRDRGTTAASVARAC